MKICEVRRNSWDHSTESAKRKGSRHWVLALRGAGAYKWERCSPSRYSQALEGAMNRRCLVPFSVNISFIVHFSEVCNFTQKWTLVVFSNNLNQKSQGCTFKKEHFFYRILFCDWHQIIWWREGVSTDSKNGVCRKEGESISSTNYFLIQTTTVLLEVTWM